MNEMLNDKDVYNQLVIHLQNKLEFLCHQHYRSMFHLNFND
jgi:hypothetical protein